MNVTSTDIELGFVRNKHFMALQPRTRAAWGWMYRDYADQVAVMADVHATIRSIAKLSLNYLRFLNNNDLFWRSIRASGESVGYETLLRAAVFNDMNMYGIFLRAYRGDNVDIENILCDPESGLPAQLVQRYRDGTLMLSDILREYSDYLLYIAVS